MRRRLKDRRLVGINLLADYIDSTPGSVRQMIHHNKLPFPYTKFGRKLLFDLEDVDAWIETLPRYGRVEGV